MFNKISRKFTSNRRLISNSSSMVGSRLVQSISAFVVLAAIARTLGPEGLGQYTLAFTYYLVFMTLASSGFKTLFTREIARDPSASSTYLVSGTFLQLLFSVLGYGVMCLVVHLMPYTPVSTVICYVMGLAIIPFSLSNVIEAIFQAQERMHLIAVCTIPVYVLRTIVTIAALLSNVSIVWIAGIFVVSEGIIFLLQGVLIQRFVVPVWRLDSSFIRQTLKTVRTFLAIEGMAVFRDRMQIFILSLFATESAIGLFGSVIQLTQPFQIVANSLVLAMFPGMSKASLLNSEKQRALAEKTIETLLFISLPMFVGIMLLGQDLLLFVYKNENFADASMILTVVALSMITRSFNQPLSYNLVANHLERINLFEVINGTFLGCLVSFFMVQHFQLNGAAAAKLLVQTLACTVYLVATYRNLFNLRFFRLLLRPLAVSGLVFAVISLSRFFSFSFMGSVLASIAAYCCMMYAVLFLIPKASPGNAS